MTSSTDIVVRYLEDAKATEAGLESMLAAQVAILRGGDYRTRVDRRLVAARTRIARLNARLEELGAGPGPLARGLEIAEIVVGRTIAVGRLPIDILRGGSGEAAVLKSAKELCAGEALEIATLRAVEQLALDVGDRATAALARELRAEDERLLCEVHAMLPALASDVVDAELTDHGTFDVIGVGEHPAQAAS